MKYEAYFCEQGDVFIKDGSKLFGPYSYDNDEMLKAQKLYRRAEFEHVQDLIPVIRRHRFAKDFLQQVIVRLHLIRGH